MRVREIVPDQWQLFFSEFTLLHHGRHIHVETTGAGIFGVQTHFCDRPLTAVVLADPEGHGRDEWIEVIAGDTPKAHATYSITKPSNVRLAEEENGEAVALQVESANGQITIIRFEPSRENLPRGFLISR